MRLLLILLVLTANYSFAQETHFDTLLAKSMELKDELLIKKVDTNYIETYERITWKTSAQNRFNAQGISNGGLASKIWHRPDLGITLGLGMATKSFAFDINTQFGISENKIKSSSYSDIQFRLFTTKHYVRLRYQYYLGYQLNDASGIGSIRHDDDRIREDLRTLQFGVHYLYSINYDKFSIKAPFALNERQKKSAGSFITGMDFLLYSMDVDSSIIPKDLENSNTAWNDLKGLNTFLISVNFGYMYSFVLKDNFFFTTSLIPGVGLKGGDYRQAEREIMDNIWMLRLNSMNALGYNGKRITVGLQFNVGWNYLPLEGELAANLIEGRSSLYFGYRI